MKYRVEDKYFDDIEDVIDYCICDDYHEDDDSFEEWLNEIYGRISIAGNEYYAYDIIKELDNYTFNELKREYCNDQNDADRENTRWELNRATGGEEIWCQAYDIEVINDEPEENEESSNESYIEQTRRYLDEQKHLRKLYEEESEKNENDLLSLFQVIGA